MIARLLTDSQTFKVPYEDDNSDAISSQSHLINRAIAMHLLREGKFDVARTFLHEASEIDLDPHGPTGVRSPNPNGTNPEVDEWENKSAALQKQFSEMYWILGELRQNHNLDPAIEWARNHAQVLENSGSNLEFELCRLRFVSLFRGYDNGNGNMVDSDGDLDMGDPQARILRAGAYARSNLSGFQDRYLPEINQLIGAIAFWQNVEESPYARLFASESAWDDVATSFTREFCSLLGLSADSPLYIATTAGAIALPVLAKVKTIMKAKRTEWTTQEELPVEIPLPPAFHFHSIFVCPVSKEQATDRNPPMMMPCGHVICKESLMNVSRSARFKCPYCPMESHPKEAKQVFL